VRRNVEGLRKKTDTIFILRKGKEGITRGMGKNNRKKKLEGKANKFAVKTVVIMH